MACLRKWRGALACALWASVAACFLATGTTRHPPRSVKLRGLPPRVDAGDANVFWAAVQKAAARNGTDVQTYMKSLVALARGHMSSSNVVDRDAAIESMMESMQEPGKLTLVLGGKNLGKSFLKKTALQRSSDKVVALSVDMRSRPGTNLLDSILVSANQSWEEVADEEGISGILGSLSGMVSAAVVVQQNMGQAANPFATMANNLVKTVVETVTKKSFVRSAVDAFLARVKTKPTAIVVDEANLALPGLTNGEKARSEAKEALAAITQWTKQDNLASVVLISSEFAYPFSLQAAGLDLRDIGKVMVIGEVPKHDMLQMLKNDWGMDDGLAQLFYDYFGGDIFTTKQALDQLIQKKETFNPYAVVDCPGLPSCVKDSKARAHLENIAQQGFSFLEDVETDAGARLIAQKNVGGVIRNGAVTFGLPDIFNSTDYEWAVIPSSYHMKWRVARALANIPLPTPGPSAGSAGTTSASVWVRELARNKDGTIIAKSRQDPEGEEELERAFKVESPQDHPRLNDVDDLAKAIKQRNPVGLKDIDARNIDIYLYSQEAGEWQRIRGGSTSLRQNTSEHDCYGFLPGRPT